MAEGRVAGRTQHVERLGIGYLYMGAWVPNTSGKAADKEFRVGPHTMVVSPAPDELQGFKRDGSNGVAYVTHLNGGDQLFLVIPIRQFDNP